MCGIAGILRFDGQAADPQRLDAMTAALRHRGPDDGGCFLDGPVGLGSRRLSIIDLAGGHQPMSNDDESVWVVYNGETYNFRELRRLLESLGHRFRTTSDTEVVIRAYEAFGVAGIERLRGMFAFALWDRNARRLVVARDQLGIKPLYYHQDDRGLTFASEIRSLLLDPRVPRRLSLTALDDFLSFSYVPGEETIFNGIRRLPPGHLLVSEGGRVEIRRYWTLELHPDRDGDEERYAEELRAILEGAVKRHLVADVPVGVFLSGGLDSSSIVALMAKLGHAEMPAFSVGFQDGAAYFDESEGARQVAAHFGVEHRRLIVKPQIADLLPRVVASLEEPLADPSAFLTYLISHAAREHVTVALTGIGGDELFAGYRRYLGARLVAPLRRLPAPLRDAARFCVTRIPATGETRLGYHLTTLQRFLEAAQAPQPDAYISTLSYFSPALKAALYRPDVRAALADHDGSAAFRAHFARSADGDLLGRLFHLDLMTFLPDNLLLFSDKMSMAASLELRVPLLDLELVEFAARLPARLRLRGMEMKYLLRKAMGPLLPPAVLAKPKQGFSAPVGQWIRTELRGYADELLRGEVVGRRGLVDPSEVGRLLAEHQAGRRDWGYQLFTLMVLELWCRTYLDSGSVPSTLAAVRRVAPARTKLATAGGTR